MANTETLSVKITAKDDTGSGINSAQSSLSGFGRMATGLFQGIGLGAGKMLFDGIVSGVQKAVTAIPDLAMRGAEIGAVQNTFDNLTKSIGTTSDAMIGDLRVAARGMVSDTELMRASNKFMMMGLADTSEEAAELTEMATQLGSAVGMDATTAMADFAAMLANQSIPRLDNFGISSGAVRARIEELTDANKDMTREQAFMTAVMEEGVKTMDRVGEQGETTAGRLSTLQSTFANIKDAIAEAASPFIDTFAPVIQDFVDQQGPEFFKWLEKIGGYLFGTADQMSMDPLTGMMRIEPGQVGLMEKWADELGRILDLIAEGDWTGIFEPLETWLDSGEFGSTFADLGTGIGDVIVNAIAGVFGAEATTNSLAAHLGTAIGRIPSALSWVFWGAGDAIARQIIEGVGMMTPERDATLDAMLEAGMGPTLKALGKNAWQSTGGAAWDWAMGIPQRDLERIQRREELGQMPYAVEDWAMLGTEPPLAFGVSRATLPGIRPASETGLPGIGSIVADLGPTDMDVTVTPTTDRLEWQKMADEAFEAFKTQWDTHEAEFRMGLLDTYGLLGEMRAQGAR